MTVNDQRLESLLLRMENLLSRVESLLPDDTVPWQSAIAFRWYRHWHKGFLKPVQHVHSLTLRDLRCIDRQKHRLQQNTEQFLTNRPFNHVLLWGSRGTGKSSLVKALLNDYAHRGLRLIEVDKDHLLHLPEIITLLHERPEHFLLFCDDLSFNADDAGYRPLKALLDGSISAIPDNVMLCATSNRRHLIPEYRSENRESRQIDGELHHGETVEEKISLSERFGLWLAFHPFSQNDYLQIVHYWLAHYQYPLPVDEALNKAACRWTLERGSRSGRVARQFARDITGACRT